MQSKKRKKPNAAWQEQQELSAKITQLPAPQQAKWLCDSWRTATGVSDLETEVISGNFLPSYYQKLHISVKSGQVLSTNCHTAF